MTIEKRLDRLERDRRWMTVPLLAALVGIGVLLMRPTRSAEPPALDSAASAPPPAESELAAPEEIPPATREERPPPVPGVVRATSFVLVDAEGHRRGELTVGGPGESSLVFTDEDGTVRARFGVLDGGSSGYELTDGTGRKWVDMACYHRGGATLIFEDEVIERQLYFGMWHDGVTRLTFGRNEKSVLDFWDDSDGMSIRGNSVSTPWGD